MSDVENHSGSVHTPGSVHIPISHSTSPDVLYSTSPGRMTGIERQMDNEVEQVFREWDENMKCRKQSSFHVRPTSTTSAAEKRRRRFPHSMTKSLGDAPTKRFEFPEIDIIRKEDSNFNASTESLEDDAKRHFYMESPTTGKRVYHMEFDVHGYDQRNITVKVSGNRLIVHAVQEETATGRKSTTEFCRKVKLPGDVDITKLQCTCTMGRLVLEAPAPKASHSGGGTPTFSVSSPRVEPLNKPLYRDTPQGKSLHLTVEMGRMFRADDVLVKVKSQNKLVIHAHREDSQDKSRLNATVTREFDLEEKVIPQSLKAGLTLDGLLKVTAQVLVEVRVITNGIDEEDEEQITNGDTQPADNSNT